MSQHFINPSQRIRVYKAYAAFLTAVMFVGTFLFTGCSKHKAFTLPPPEVLVTPVVQKDVPIYQEWIGTLDGMVNAVIKAQVTGYLLKQIYQEGSLVHKGQLMFELDPRSFIAALDQAEGQHGQAYPPENARGHRLCLLLPSHRVIATPAL